MAEQFFIGSIPTDAKILGFGEHGVEVKLIDGRRQTLHYRFSEEHPVVVTEFDPADVIITTKAI